MGEQPDIDFLQKKYDLKPTRKVKREKRKKPFLITLSALIIVATLFSYQISRTQSPNAAGIGLSFLSSITGLVTSDTKALVGEDTDRVNFLLLGVGGDGHDGAQLSDTIILASLRPSTGEVAMLSIPRDLAVNIPGYGYGKINAANAYGERAGEGQGPELSKQVIEQITGQEIHYHVKVDFNSFEELIDSIGGVDVYVERSFTDSQFPTYDYLYQTVRFTEGWTSLDGEEALQFSRSRHGNNGEGSDFARAARQQKVILAAKDRILSPAILLNPAKLNKMVNLFADNVSSNLTIWEMIKLSGYAPSVEADQIKHVVLDSSPGGALFNSTNGAAFVLKPKVSDWSEIQAIAANIFEEGDSFAIADGEPEERDALTSTSGAANIAVWNGTLVSGLAGKASQVLEGSGYTVTEVNNADRQTYPSTIIFDYTNGQKPEELETLRAYFDAKTPLTIESWATSTEVQTAGEELQTPPELEVEPDFLIILGDGSVSLLQ